MKRTNIIILSTALLITACGSGTDEQSKKKEPSESTMHQPIEVQKVAVEKKTAPVIEKEQAKTKTTSDAPSHINKSTSAVAVEPDVKATKLADLLLPTGRLTGIIDTGDYKQAIIDDQGKITRVKEGGDWQGWSIKEITADAIVVSKENNEKSLSLLSEFRAPTLTKTEIEQKKQRLARIEENNAVAVETNIPPLKLTQKQLSTLRNNLIMGR